MDSDGVSSGATEDFFASVRARPLTLGQRLQLIAEDVRQRNPTGAAVVDRFVARLEEARAGSAAPQPGEVMPNFTLPDHSGKLTSLDELLEQGPAIVAVHRGHWCPYCRMNMAGLAEIQDRLAPANVVAISTELPAFTRVIRADAGAKFPFLSDIDAGYSLALNLAIFVDPELQGLLEATGKAVPEFQGGLGWIIPVPAVFVVDRQGIVRARHVDPDYRRRMELDAILTAVAALR